MARGHGERERGEIEEREGLFTTRGLGFNLSGVLSSCGSDNQERRLFRAPAKLFRKTAKSHQSWNLFLQPEQSDNTKN